MAVYYRENGDILTNKIPSYHQVCVCVCGFFFYIFFDSALTQLPSSLGLIPAPPTEEFCEQKSWWCFAWTKG